MKCVTYYNNHGRRIQFRPEEIDGFDVVNDHLALKRFGKVVYIIAKGYWKRVGIESDGAVV